MSSSELGAGLSLDEHWDLYVDRSTGDLAFDTAGVEVRKDLAFMVGRAMQDVEGEVISDGFRADLRLYIRKLIQKDVRIDTVDSVEVEFDQVNNTLDIDVVATTVTGVDIDEVFTVER